MDTMDYCTERYTGDWKTYLEPADVKSPHMSELGCAAGTGELKSKRGAGFGGKTIMERKNDVYVMWRCSDTKAVWSPVLVWTAGTVCCPPGGGMTPPAFAPGGGGSRPPPIGRSLAPPASFFLMFYGTHRLVKASKCPCHLHDYSFLVQMQLRFDYCFRSHLYHRDYMLTPMLILIVCPSLKLRSSLGAALWEASSFASSPSCFTHLQRLSLKAW